MGRHECLDLENTGAYLSVERVKFLHFLHISIQHRFIFCSTPKVACSSMLLTLQRFELAYPGLTHDPWSAVHYREFSPLLTPLQVSSFRAWMLDPAVFKFCFVRNPYDRLLSAYLDKIVMTSGFRARFLNRLGRSGGDVSFEEFIEVAVAEQPEEMDEHYAIQARHTFQHYIPYDYIGRFESLPESMAEVARRIGMDLPAYEARVDGHKTGPKDFRRYYTPRLVRLVQEKYAEDFELFGYPDTLPCAAARRRRNTGVPQGT